MRSTRLVYLAVVVFEAEEVGHVVRRNLFLSCTADVVLVHHRLALVQVFAHLHTLDVHRLGHAVRLIVEVRVVCDIVRRLDVDLESMSAFGRSRGITGLKRRHRIESLARCGHALCLRVLNLRLILVLQLTCHGLTSGLELFVRSLLVVARLLIRYTTACDWGQFSRVCCKTVDVRQLDLVVGLLLY